MAKEKRKDKTLNEKTTDFISNQQNEIIRGTFKADRISIDDRGKILIDEVKKFNGTIRINNGDIECIESITFKR